MPEFSLIQDVFVKLTRKPARSSKAKLGKHNEEMQNRAQELFRPACEEGLYHSLELATVSTMSTLRPVKIAS